MRNRISCLVAALYSSCAVFGLGVFSPAFSLESASVLKVSERRDDRPPNTVRGDLKEVRPEFVVLGGKRFRLAPAVQVKDEEENILKEGVKTLRSEMEVELTLEGDAVIAIKIFGLLMR